jgi:hypothetical protein
MAMSQKQLNTTWEAAQATDDYDLFSRVFTELPDEILAKHANSKFEAYGRCCVKRSSFESCVKCFRVAAC